MNHLPEIFELTTNNRHLLFFNPKTKSMQLYSFCKDERLRSVAIKKTFRIVKALTIILLVFSFQSSANNLAQEITLSLKNVKLETVFKEIQKQTTYRFIYTNEQLETSRKVSLEVKGAQLENVLQLCFKEQPLTYTIEEKFVIIALKENRSEGQRSYIQLIDVFGKITNEQGQSLPGASVSVKGTSRGTATDGSGEFILRAIESESILVISSIGYETQSIDLHGQTVIAVQLRMAVTILDETVVMAYGTTTKRLNTGSINKVTSTDISKQPVSNPLAALEGRVPGLLITQSNGLPGSNFSVLIRGRNSLQNGNSPLYIIDGIPFLNDADRLAQRSSLNANSPFNSINPTEIESIEILKDADATAIYGSRGANGVILITTKKNKSKGSKVEANIYYGWGKVTRTMDFLNTPQYLQMRHEAFANDGIAPTIANAPDLLAWDTTRYTDWKKLLIGNTANTTNAQLVFSSAIDKVNFSLGANYYSETTVYPGESGDKRTSVYLNASHTSPDKKLSINAGINYAIDKSTLVSQDLTSFITLPPNAPLIYDSTGNLNWSENGARYSNPFALLLQEYQGITDRLTAHANIEAKVYRDLYFKISTGYNFVQFNETGIVPIISQDPASNPKGSANFGSNTVKSWIVEPQLEYSIQVGKKGKLKTLFGFTFQHNENKSIVNRGTGYTNDALIKSITGAGTITATDNSSLYRYEAVFGRINYNWDNKYFINLTGRRDGSSRFGPGKQFANFGAIGMAWNFSEEKFFQNNLSFISFGKIRSSYGITGNDQIGDYNYLDTWGAARFPFQGQPALTPIRLYNPDYSWEQIRKFEAAIELGFLKDRILITTNWFLSRSDNQLVFYSLPSQTGFTGILKNFPGQVQNKGLEFELTGTWINKKGFTWATNFNITAAKNILRKFPGLATSNYATTYAIGEPTNVKIGYHYLGVDPQTGIYKYEDKNQDGLFNSSDYYVLGNTNPKFYGGIEQKFRYKNWNLDFLFQFVKHEGLHPVFYLFSSAGQKRNEPLMILDHWQKPGQSPEFQKYTQQFGTPASLAASQTYNSSAGLTDASYIRLKNLSLSYSLPEKIVSKSKIKQWRIYVQGQNLLTFTSFVGSDPESQLIQALPPLSMLTFGTQLTF